MRLERSPFAAPAPRPANDNPTPVVRALRRRPGTTYAAAGNVILPLASPSACRAGGSRGEPAAQGSGERAVVAEVAGSDSPDRLGAPGPVGGPAVGAVEAIGARVPLEDPQHRPFIPLLDQPVARRAEERAAEAPGPELGPGPSSRSRG